MLARNVGRILAISIILTVIAASASAQQTVYRWVDKDGVVHFGDEPPGDVENVEAVTLPAFSAPAAQPVVEVPVATKDVGEDHPVQAEFATPPPVREVNISNMSLVELDQRCEGAREKRIAPLRQAEIEKCKQDKRNDPAWCDRFNADFGDGGRTAAGTFRPRMFNDLTECLDAVKERNRRGL